VHADEGGAEKRRQGFIAAEDAELSFFRWGHWGELHLAAAQEDEAGDTFSTQDLEYRAAMQRELHVLRPDRELPRDVLCGGIDSQPVESLHVCQAGDTGNAPGIGGAAARPADVEPSGQHARSRRRLRHHLDNDGIAVAGK
jgi:hypothetical protein